MCVINELEADRFIKWVLKKFYINVICVPMLKTANIMLMFTNIILLSL